MSVESSNARKKLHHHQKQPVQSKAKVNRYYIPCWFPSCEYGIQAYVQANKTTNELLKYI